MTSRLGTRMSISFFYSVRAVSHSLLNIYVLIFYRAKQSNVLFDKKCNSAGGTKFQLLLVDILFTKLNIEYDLIGTRIGCWDRPPFFDRHRLLPAD